MLVQAVILTAGVRWQESGETVGASGPAGLYSLALGGADAVRGKGREHEDDPNLQAFEKPGAKAVDWLAEVRDELTDAGAWMTGAYKLSGLTGTERDRYVAFISWHLALALDAVDSWIVWERVTADMRRGFIRPEDQPA